MKKSILILAIFFLASTGFATIDPILTYSKTPGFTLPAYRVSSQCYIYPNRTIVRTQVGDTLSSEEIKQIRLKDLNALKDTIEDAANGQIVTSMGPADAPGHYYMANYTSSMGLQKKVIIKIQSQVIKENTSSAAKSLKTFIDLQCK